MSQNSHNQDKINQEALHETQRFLTDAMNMINETYSACGVEAFKPEPLIIPQVITDTPQMNLSDIATNDYFKQAEAMWTGQAQFFNGQVAPPPEAPMGVGENPQDIPQQMQQAAIEMNGQVDASAIEQNNGDGVSPELQALLGDG